MRAVDLFAGWGGLERFPRGERRAILVTAFGETRSVRSWAIKQGLDVVVLLKRLKNGWHTETALTTPPLTKNNSTWEAPVSAEALRALYESGATQAEIAVALGVSERVIQVALRRLGIKCRKATKRDQLGPNNDNWKGGVLIDGAGYILVLTPGHPRATCRGYVRQHVLVMEKKLGRYLVWFGSDDPRTEIVHHKDRNKQNNHPDNLELTTYSEHAHEHRDQATGKLTR